MPNTHHTQNQYVCMCGSDGSSIYQSLLNAYTNSDFLGSSLSFIRFVWFNLIDKTDCVYVRSFVHQRARPPACIWCIGKHTPSNFIVACLIQSLLLYLHLSVTHVHPHASNNMIRWTTERTNEWMNLIQERSPHAIVFISVQVQPQPCRCTTIIGIVSLGVHAKGIYASA